MAQNLEYGVRITADGTVLVNEAGKAEQALKRIGTEAEKSSAVASRFGLAVGAAAAAGALAFGNLIKQTVNTAAAFDDLAESTGSTVENLSSLANSMAVSGVDTGTFTSLMNKLAVGLSGVDDEGGKAGKALAALGVQAKDPAAAMKELAVKLDQYADGANKAALLTAIFGRGAAQYAGALKDLARDTEMAATVTTGFAAEAENLQKEMARAMVEVDALAATLASRLVPSFRELIGEMNEGIKIAGGFWNALTTLGGINPFNTLSENLEDTRKRISDIVNDTGMEARWARALGVSDSMLERLRQREQFLTYQLQRAANARYGASNADARDLALASMNRRPDAPVVSDAAKTKAAVDHYLKGMSDIADALKREDAERKKVLDGYREQLDLMDKLYEANAKSIDSIAKETEGYQKRINALTLTKDELYALDIAKLQAIVDARTYEGYINAETEALIRQLDTLKQLRSVESAHDASEAAQKAAEEWQRAADSIGNSLTDALLRGFESGKDWAQNFVQTLKNMFGTLVLRPVIQAIVAPAAGSITGALGFAENAAASGGSALGGIGNLGSMFGGLGSLGSGASISFGNVASLGLLEGSLANFANIGGQLASGVSGIMPALGMAMPYIAAVAMIGMAIKGILDSKRGGPKSGGFASSGAIGALSNSDNGRWFTPNSADSAMQDVTKGLMTSYGQILASLGGSGSAGFALGYDTDPQGTAPNRLHAGAFVNGQSVYDAALGDLGRDDATLQAALELESKRALLAALQASELPAQIAAVFDSVAASGASSEAIDNLLAYGAAMKAVIDSIGGSVVEDAQRAWEQSQRSSVQILRDMGAEVIRLANNMDGSTSSMQALATATGEYRAAVVQTLVAIKQISADVAAMFGATRNSLEEFGLSPEALYDRYRRDADEAAALLASATDPASVQKLSERINADINAAFNALGDEGKSQQKDPLLTYLNGIDALAASKLATLSASIGSSTADPFAAANAALDGAAAKFASAAGVQADAASTLERAAAKIDAAASRFETAANTPMQAYVVANEVG